MARCQHALRAITSLLQPPRTQHLVRRSACAWPWVVPQVLLCFSLLLAHPGSHRRIYHQFHRQHSYTPAGPGLPAAPGYTGELPEGRGMADNHAVMQQIREDTTGVDTFGPAGMVILMCVP